MNKDPAFLFYSSDFLTGIVELTMEERGQYITLLCLQHQKGHLNEKTIRLSVGLVSDDVMSKFVKGENGLFYNERLEIEIDKRENFVESRRENGKLGGRPKKPSGKPNAKPNGKAKKKLLGDVNENENINEIINNYFKDNKILKNYFKELLNIRKKLKAVNSERAIKLILKDLDDCSEAEKLVMISKAIKGSWKTVYELDQRDKEKLKNKVPDWFDKKILNEEMNETEKQELEELLKEFK